MNRSASTMTAKTRIKIVLIGDQSTGKSSVIQRYVKGQFDPTSHPTVGIDFLVKNITHASKTYRLQLWDTAGQQRFWALIPNYLKDAKCALIVFDVSNRASLNNTEMWLKMYNENRKVQGFSILIGNKIDLEYRQVSSEQGQKKARQLGIPYYEISAKTGAYIDVLFTKIVDKVEQRTVSFELGKDDAHMIKQEEEAEDVGEVERQKQQNNNIVLNKKNGQTFQKTQKCC